MSHSTKSKSGKPAKPYPEFPLFAHANGSWCKKIRGKLIYFGPWADPQAAIDKYLDQRDDLHAGRTPRARAGGLTVAGLANRYLTSKRHLLDTGEIVERSFRDCHSTCKRLVENLGTTRLVDDLAADDFAKLRKIITKTRGPVATGCEITRIKSVFRYGFDENLIEKPIRYGQSFKPPSAKTLRIERAKNGKRMFEASELRTIIDAAEQPIKGMVLLACNAGFGNSDMARLPMEVVIKALESGWIDFPRPKTGVPRRCPLWTETREALQEAIASRPEPENEADDGLAFLTKKGRRWVQPRGYDEITVMFRRLLESLGLWKPRLNFYALRHGFETVGGGRRDQVAVNSLMGHVDATMSGLYREEIEDDRLQAVVDHVHNWLFGE